MNYAEIRTLTPELGCFTITGQLEEVESAVKSFGRLKVVSNSTLDRALRGEPLRRRVFTF